MSSFQRTTDGMSNGKITTTTLRTSSKVSNRLKNCSLPKSFKTRHVIKSFDNMQVGFQCFRTNNTEIQKILCEMVCVMLTFIITSYNCYFDIQQTQILCRFFNRMFLKVVLKVWYGANQLMQGFYQISMLFVLKFR